MKLAAGAAWLVDSSPYSPHDPGDNNGMPDPDHLDYALLRLQRPVGDDDVAGKPRGWMALDANVATLAAGSILFIGQHPELNP